MTSLSKPKKNTKKNPDLYPYCVYYNHEGKHNIVSRHETLDNAEIKRHRLQPLERLKPYSEPQFTYKLGKTKMIEGI